MPNSSRQLLVCLAFLALAAILPASASARVPPSFVGLVNEALIDAPAAERQATLGAQARAGTGTLRQVFDWARIERTRDGYELSEYDELVAAAAQNRVGVLPVLFNPPAFRSSRPETRARRGVYPPRHADDMGRFAAALVRRYGPGGTLWSERPQLRRMPIRSWQVWNEPNLRVYWASGPSPRAYTRLLRTVGRAIERVDPGAEIVSAGLPQSRAGIGFARYVTGMYRAGARNAFDTLAVHPYARDHRGGVAATAMARRLMNRAGDPRGRIWVTEIGWASSGPPSTFRVGPSGQARRVRGALLGLARARKRLRLRGVVIYQWEDNPPAAGVHDFFGYHTGLLQASGRRKPAFYAFARAARSLRR